MMAHILSFVLMGIFIEGVTCQVTGIRLTGGTSTAGRVEVLRTNGWGTVCEDSWDNRDAGVVCRALRFRSGTAITGAPFGRGSLPVSLFQVLCGGSEATLNACPLTTQGTCTNGGGAAVNCSNSGGGPVQQICTNPSTNVRLANNKPGVPAGIGVVEVRDPISRTWGAVCSDGFDVNAARVICRMLCYNDTYSRPLILPNTTFVTRLNVMVTNVSCTGREADFYRDCQHHAWNSHSCAPSEAVAITCLDYNPCYPYDCYKAPPRLVVDCNDTYIEVKFSLLEQPRLTVNHLNVIPDNCTVLKYITTAASGQRFIAILFGVRSCAVNLTYNATHFIYHAKLQQVQSLVTNAVITRDRSYMIDVVCALPREYNVSKPFELITESITASGLGRFFVRMRFWYTDFFIRYYTTLVRIPVGDCLNVTVELITTNPTLKIGVPDCWVTPHPISTTYMYRDLFVNRRLVETTTIMYPLDALRVGFQYRVFQFVGYQQVMVHCKAVVCDQNDRSPDCLRNYIGRKKRSTSHQLIQVDSEPIFIFNSNNDPTGTVQTSPSAQTARSATTRTPTSWKLESTSTTRFSSAAKQTTTSATTATVTTTTSTTTTTTKPATTQSKTTTTTTKPTTTTTMTTPTTTTTTTTPTTTTTTTTPTTTTTTTMPTTTTTTTTPTTTTTTTTSTTTTTTTTPTTTTTTTMPTTTTTTTTSTTTTTTTTPTTTTTTTTPTTTTTTTTPTTTTITTTPTTTTTTTTPTTTTTTTMPTTTTTTTTPTTTTTTTTPTTMTTTTTPTTTTTTTTPTTTTKTTTTKPTTRQVTSAVQPEIKSTSTQLSTATTTTTSTPESTTSSTVATTSPLSSAQTVNSSSIPETAQALDMSISLNTWKDAKFTHPLWAGTPVLPGTLSNVSVNMDNSDSQYSIDVSRCWVAPVGNEKLYIELIKNKHITEKTLTVLKMNNISLGFSFKTPEFSGYHSICIHCEVLICDDKQCLTLYHIRSQHITTEKVSRGEGQITPPFNDKLDLDQEPVALGLSAGSTLRTQFAHAIICLASAAVVNLMIIY